MISPINPQLLIQTFGIASLQTSIYKGKINGGTPDTPTVDRKSALGTAIFSDLQFRPITVPSPNGFTDIQHQYPVDTVLFSVNQVKDVIRTNINGRNGTIKEYNGLGDYQINIKGVICGERGVYPREAVKNLREFLEYNLSIGIYSNYLNDVYNIDEIVILDYDLPQEEGSYNMQRFEISAISDFPVEILIQQQK